MQSIREIVQNKVVCPIQLKELDKRGRKKNEAYERAFYISKRVNVPVIILLKLIKFFGEKNVLAMEGWLSDCQPYQKNIAYLTTVMKQRFPNVK